MLSLYIILGIMLFHWIGDFVLQSDEDAKCKWRCFKSLLSHVLGYTAILINAGIIFVKMAHPSSNDETIIWAGIVWGVTNGMLHLIVDFFTSKVTHRLYEANKHHDFFVVIGLDQLLHYAILLITFKLMILDLEFIL